MDLEAVQEIEVDVEETGLQGYSAYEVAVQNGFEGTEEEWLASLKGADGRDGAIGPRGPQGESGTDGVDGTDATINGVSTLNIVAGDNVTIEQDDSTLTISSTGGGTTDYTDLTNKPSINNVTLSGNLTTSELGINIPDVSNFITKDVDNLTNYYKKSETYTKTEVDNKVSSVYKYKGTVSTYGDLPSTNLTVGDVYNIETADSTHGIKAGDNVAWTGSVWDVLAGTVDLSGYQTKIDGSHKLSSDLVDDTSNTNLFVTSSEKSTWNGKYDKPSGGIPSTDLSSAVQTSLGKADTALQSYTEQYTGTITSVKMNGSTISNSGEADLGTVITSHQDISGKQDTMQFNTMPTASSETVGKIVQYTGTTGNDYTNGYFYIGTSTTENNETTYDWENINVQAGGSSNYIDTFFIKVTDSGDITNFSGIISSRVAKTWTLGTVAKRGIQEFLQKIYDEGKTYFNIALFSSDYSICLPWFRNDIQSKPAIIDFYYSERGRVDLGIMQNYSLRLWTSWSGNTLSLTGAQLATTGEISYLSKDNTTAYTPSSDYHPATKKYVDDKGTGIKIISDSDNLWELETGFYIGQSSTVIKIGRHNNISYNGPYFVCKTLISSSSTMSIYLLNSSGVATMYNYFVTSNGYNVELLSSVNFATVNDKIFTVSGLSKYSSSTTYQIGDLIYRGSLIYECNTADTTGTWDSSKWTQKTYMEYLNDMLAPTVTTSSTSTYTITSLTGNNVYKLGEITSLTITEVSTFDKESVIYFESGSTATTISIPDTLINLGDVPTLTTASNVSTGTCTASKNYIISVLNNIAVWKEY